MVKPISIQPRSGSAPSGAPSSATPPAPSGPVLFAAPHRPMFLAGVVQIFLSFLPWCWEMLARAGVAPGLTWPWPPGWVHGLLGLYGIFPFFVFGFLLTAMPRWQGMPDTPGKQAQAPWLLLVTGWALVDLGLVLAPSWLPALGLVAVLAGWGRVLHALWPVARKPGASRLHALPAWTALAAGGLGLVCWLGFALGGAPTLARAAVAIGLWWMLLPLFMVVSHRMIPFFSSSALPNYTPWRPHGMLHLLLAASALHGLLAVLDQAAWAWPGDLAAAGMAGYASYRWQLRRSLSVRLLGMLHLGFIWLGISWALYAAQGLAQLLGHPMLGLAPLHALTVGFFSTLTLAMVSRVSLGHSGRPLVADSLTWRLALAVHLVAILRVAAELWPTGQAVLLVFASFGWVGVFMPWALRLLPIYLRARVDGRPG